MKLNSKLAWAFIPVIFLALLTTSCSKADKEQLALLDSLQVQIDETGKALAIDTAKLASRKRLIETNMNIIRVNYTEQFTVEMARAMDIYRGIFKMYRVMLERYPEMAEEQEALEKQIRDLRYSLKKGTVTAAGFDRYYQVEKADVQAHSDQVKLYAFPVNEVEPMYKEISETVNEAVKRANQED